jgi:hypothetical protein
MNCKISVFRHATAGAILSLVLVDAPALAQGPGWTVPSTIVKLVDTADGGVNVRLSPDVVTCVSNSGYGANFASVYPSHPGLKSIKATLLTAFTTNTPVMLYFNDANCTIIEVILGA